MVDSDSDNAPAGEQDNDDEPMSHAERGKKGGRPPLATREDVLDAVREVLAESDAPIVRTPDVVKRLPIGNQTTRDHLGTLVEQSELRSLSVGSGKVWWIDESEDGDSPDEQDDDGPIFKL
ncbi:hypothetical protein [Halalkalicoccus tibetensis]|uniref:Uncharacterized protein n=1 Tax=Halalkalicoccus tibetensis TaxID=175632 RepID=A0ABD5V5J7_9EURY